MTEATTEERQNLAELNSDQNSDEEGFDSEQKKSDSRPNIAVYGMIGVIGAIGDLLGLIPIPVLNSILRAPFQLIVYFWKLMSGKLHESQGQKILTNSLIGLTPLPSNTTFIITSYLEETKLGKKTIGKLSKANSIKK